MDLFSLDVWTISCRRYYSGWASQQTFGGAGHAQQSSGDREADWQGPQVTCGREQNRGRHQGSLISWPSPAPGRSGPALAQVPAPAPGASASWLTAALWQVNEMRGEAISKGSSSSESLVSREAGGNYSSYLPWEVRRAFPRQRRPGHARSPHRTQGAAGLAINSSWGLATGLRWAVFRGSGWVWGGRLGWKGSILEPRSGSEVPLRPLGSRSSLEDMGCWLWSR